MIDFARPVWSDGRPVGQITAVPAQTHGDSMVQKKTKNHRLLLNNLN